VDKLFSILPFEVDFFERKHGYPITYVGNPTMDEVTAFLSSDSSTAESFREANALNDKPIIALLAGSRRQEIKDNLLMMVEAASAYADRYQLVLAGAPSIPAEYYRQVLAGRDVKIVFGQTFGLLKHSEAALVTSGTATLETALFGVPQVVCYYTACGRLVSFLRRHLLKVPYISLVNLIAGREVVTELVADGMTVENVGRELAKIVAGGEGRSAMLRGYAYMRSRLGEAGAPRHAAREMVKALRSAGASKSGSI
jgi:lipid-A-disaccharide synthase